MNTHTHNPDRVAIAVAIAHRQRTSAPPGDFSASERSAFHGLLKIARAEQPNPGRRTSKPAPKPATSAPRAAGDGDFVASLRAHLDPATRAMFDAAFAKVRSNPIPVAPHGARLPPPAGPAPASGWLQLSDREKQQCARFALDPVLYLATRRVEKGKTAAERTAGKMVAEALFAEHRDRASRRAPRLTIAESAAIAVPLERRAIDFTRQWERTP